MKVKRVVFEDFYGRVTEHSTEGADTFFVDGGPAFSVGIEDGVLTIRQDYPSLEMDDRTLKAYAKKRFGKLSVEL